VTNLSARVKRKKMKGGRKTSAKRKGRKKANLGNARRKKHSRSRKL